MLRLLLVANPSASGFTGAMHRTVAAALTTRYQVTPVWPDGPDAARQAAKDAAADGYDVVAAMGGDGVVHHVANGLVRTSTALGVIPSGTTNVFARILGIPSKPKEAAEFLAYAMPTPISMAHLATDSAAGARSTHAAFAAGIGFDAEVVAVAEQRPYSKVRFGGLHYARTSLAMLWARRAKPANLRIDCDGDRVDAATVLVQVHWPFSYFGRLPLRITPQPVAGLTALALEHVGPGTASALVGRLVARRRLDEMPGVHLWTNFDKLVIDAEPAALFQADGEFLGPTDALEVTPSSDSLLVMAPVPDHVSADHTLT